MVGEVFSDRDGAYLSIAVMVLGKGCVHLNWEQCDDEVDVSNKQELEWRLKEAKKAMTAYNT